KQLEWITLLYGNLRILFGDREDVFVGGDLLWYPVEGEPTIVNAPDVFVVFGRPKGDRGSYKQWEEAGVPFTVVFEVLSPGNTVTEMEKKLAFYEEHGVEEYYLYDPDANFLTVRCRRGTTLVGVRPANGHISTRLGIRFELTDSGMTVYHPNGRRFLSVEELEEERLRLEQRATQAEGERRRAEAAEQSLARLKELSR